mmetsp:Transcript_5951/g.13869  ORF Transcript_5951/g.13869 Transcript_5951/m.13869 type:complete len:211 (-) Transcript_5951:4-636(-)
MLARIVAGDGAAARRSARPSAPSTPPVLVPVALSPSSVCVTALDDSFRASSFSPSAFSAAISSGPRADANLCRPGETSDSRWSVELERPVRPGDLGLPRPSPSPSPSPSPPLPLPPRSSSSSSDSGRRRPRRPPPPPSSSRSLARPPPSPPSPSPSVSSPALRPAARCSAACSRLLRLSSARRLRAVSLMPDAGPLLPTVDRAGTGPRRS